MFFCLAPIRGITDHVFRSVYSAHFKGFDCAVAPFISTVKGKTVKLSHIKDILPENNRNLPVIPQVIGNNPEDFVVLCQQLYEIGYTTVNWNLGCPFPQVTKKKRGSGLLPYPEKIELFLEHVCPRIKNKLSVKTRLGLLSKDEMEKFIPVLNKFPISEVIIHPRTAKQMYSGKVDLIGFEQFMTSTIHPVMYNGDINDVKSFKDISNKFPEISRFMIGRGALSNPILLEEIQGITTNYSTITQRIKCFHDDLFKAYDNYFNNPGNLLDKMKGLWFYLSNTLPENKKFLKSIQKTNNPDEYKNIINSFSR